jgi:hypothetical protein
MAGTRSLCAKAASDLPAIEEVARDQPFPVASLRVDERTRTLVLPFERKHPRRESWELVVRGARSLSVEGKREQTADYFRSLRHDPPAGVLIIEAVLVLARVRVDGLDVEARCLTPEEKSLFDVADLPAPIRREIEERSTAQVQAHEKYEKAERERHRALVIVGALAGVALGAGTGNPWWALVLDLLAGGGSALWIARTRRSFIGTGAAAYAAPQVLVSLSGEMVRELFAGGGFIGLTLSFFWSLMAGTGILLALLNGKMMARNEGMEAGGDLESVGRKPPPLDPRFPLRAAALCGLGAASTLLLFSAPWVVWLVLAPVASGGAAWLLARAQANATTSGRVLGGIGLLLAAMAVLGGGTLAPAGLFVFVAHWVAGNMVAYYSRSEGPK